MKKAFVVIFIISSVLLFSYIVSPKNFNDGKYRVIELIPPFEKIEAISLISNDVKENIALYDLIEIKNGNFYFKGKKFTNMEVKAEFLEKLQREVWLSWEGINDIKEYIEKYSKMHDLNIKVLEVPQISSKLITMSKSNVKLPDVIMTSAFDYPTYKELNIVKGKLYNYYYDTQIVYVQKDINIVPKSWNLKTVEKIVQDTNKKIAINPISAYWFSTFLMGYGKIPLISDAFILTDENTINAFNVVKKWYENNYFDFLNKQAQIASFVNKKVALMFQGSFLLPIISEKMEDFYILPLPKPLVPFKDYKAFVSTKDGDEHFTYWLYLLLNNPDFKKYFADKYTKFFDDYIPEGKFKNVFESTQKAAQPIPFDKRYVKFHKNVSDILKLMLFNKISLQDGLKKLEEIVNE
jgi:hypothetical protein